ncbi:Vacuolar protein sorting-associated protein [Mycena venus]|uniref:Vacuolar protein sorting-associated protein n=1 Tax=Mycena venus TaxID=2733690 RepID=A0A8H6YHM8_9AGAR|nr:Vacuolar protein sorting-associated protein [Mycena venus]
MRGYVCNSRRRAPAAISPAPNLLPTTTTASHLSPSLIASAPITLRKCGPVHARSAFAGGARVAYDPHDLLEAGKDAALAASCLDYLGYLSFWNDNISYALGVCILIELALKKRIGVVRDPNRSPLLDRPITVIPTLRTDEALLDETLKMMKQTEDAGERMDIGIWVELLSGACLISLNSACVNSTLLLLCFLSFSLRCWPPGSLSASYFPAAVVIAIGFQLKQVRERLAKRLVNEDVLRTENQNFLLFYMTIHPVADARVKAGVANHFVALLPSGTSCTPSVLDAESTQCRMREGVDAGRDRACGGDVRADGDMLYAAVCMGHQYASKCERFHRLLPIF